MIPKVIHYCWFGHGKMPAIGEECIKSWQKHMPDCEIKRWDESNFDVNMCTYTRQAYEARKFAFVSDYARFWILYRFGGVYFDTDVRVLKSFNPILAQGAFMGNESEKEMAVAPGLGLGCEAGNLFLKEMIDMYEGLDFTDGNGNPNLVTIVALTTNMLRRHGLNDDVMHVQNVAGFRIYPAEFFASRINADHYIPCTSNSYSQHLYARTWVPTGQRLKLQFMQLLPLTFARFLVKAKSWLLHSSRKSN